MSKKSFNFRLSDSVELFLYPEKENFEELFKIAISKDVLEEITFLEKAQDKDPLSLLVYNQFLVWGRHFPPKNVSLDLISYSDKFFIDWVGCSLFLKNRLVKILNKMDSEESFSQRLNLITRFDWIKYDSKTNLLEERLDQLCGIKKLLLGKKPKDEIYSISENGDKIKVNYLRIKEYPSDTGVGRNFICEGNSSSYEGSKGSLLKIILSKDNDALIVEEPLIGCSGRNADLPLCISNIFLKDYVKKLNLKIDEGNKDPFKTPSEN